MSISINKYRNSLPVGISIGTLPQQIKKRLRPCFKDYLPLWTKYLDFYTGGVGIKKYIDQHPPYESNAEFKTRVDNASYDNDINRGVQRIANHIFGQPIVRANLDDMITMTNFTSNSGLTRTPDQFFRDNLIYKLVFGDMFLLLNPAIFDGTATDSQRKDKGNLWKPQNIFPTEVVIYKEDSTGATEFVMVRDVIENGKITINFIEYTDSQIITMNSKGATTNTVEHSIGRVPVLRYLFDTNRDGLGDSIIRDAVDIAKIILRVDSTIANDLIAQSFETLIIPITIANLKVLENFYPKDTNGKLIIDKLPVMPIGSDGDVTFHSKDLTYIEVKMKFIDKKKALIEEKLEERIARLVQESGIAKNIAEVNQRKALEFISSQANSDENIFWDFYLDISKAREREWFVKYPSEFDALRQDEMITAIEDFIKVAVSPEYILEAESELYKQTFKDFKTKEEIDATIKKVEGSRESIRQALQTSEPEPLPPTQR